MLVQALIFATSVALAPVDKNGAMADSKILGRLLPAQAFELFISGEPPVDPHYCVAGGAEPANVPLGTAKTLPKLQARRLEDEMPPLEPADCAFIGVGSASCSEGPGCSWMSDGACDDGGPGAYYSACPLGTDCTDCGPRGESAFAIVLLKTLAAGEVSSKP